MVDEVVMGVLQDAGVRVVAVTATGVARTARERHQARPAAAHVLAEGLVASALLSALQLQKPDARVNLQLECDGPLRGIFVESDSTGALRGYARNPFLEYEGQPGAYHWRPVYGNHGFLSVLRDRGGGDYFRSSVELEAFDLSLDLEHYFRASDQVETAALIRVLPRGEEALGAVAGVLLQILPDGDGERLRALRSRLEAGGLEQAISAQGGDLAAGPLLGSLFSQDALELTSRYPLSWRCPCSKERVERSLLTLGKAELEDILEKDGQAEATCQFCSTRYLVKAEELRALIDRLSA